METLQKNNFLTFFDFYIFFLDPKNNSAISSSLIKKCIILSEKILLHEEFLLSLNNSSNISKYEKDFILNKLLSTQEEKSKNEKTEKSKNLKNDQNFDSMTFESLINLFLSTISTIFPLLNNFPDSRRKWFYIKFPSSFGGWKTRLLLLDIKLRQIFVFKESTAINHEKEINLEFYVVRWVGEKKEKYCFCMDKCDNEKNKLPKNILFASKDETLVKEWYCFVQELKEPSNHKEINFKSKLIKVYDPLDNDSDQLKSHSSNNEISDNKEPGENKRKDYPRSFSDLPNQSDSEESLSDFKDFENAKNLLSNKLNEEGQFIPSSDSEKFEKNEGEDANNKNDIFTTPSKENDLYLKIKKNNTFKFELNDRKNENEFESNENYDKVDLKTSENYPEIIKDLITFSKSDLFHCEIGYSLIYTNNSLRITKNNACPNIFKLFLSVKFPTVRILDVLLDENSYNGWNSIIKEFKILQFLKSAHSMIVYERRDYGHKFYNFREFNYLRSIICEWQTQKFTIIDKSIELKQNIKSEISSLWRTKGNIVHNIISLIPKSRDESLIVLSIEMDNKGKALTTSQNSDLIFEFLSNFKNLEMFIEQRSILNTNKSEIQNKFSFLFNSEDDSLNFIENNFENKKIENIENDQEFKITKALSETFEMYEEEVLKPSDEENKSDLHVKIFSSEIIQINKSNTSLMLNLLSAHDHISNSIKTNYITHIINIKTPKLQIIDSIKGHYAINKDWSYGKNGGLVWFNKQEMEVQNKVLSYLIKKMGSNLIHGKSVVNISLPVTIFDNISFLERLANSYTYAPYFLENDGNETPLDYLKRSIKFLFSTLHMLIGQRKPFNPILGETYQGWINGNPIYLEQISHHPPTSAFYMIGKGYKLYGSFELTASMSPNSVVGRQIGYGTIEFNEKSEIHFTIPACYCSGLAFGPRNLTYQSKAFLFDLKNNLFSELSFNPDKKGLISSFLSSQATGIDFLKGRIFKITSNFANKIKLNLSQKNINKLDSITEKDCKELVCQMQGIWHSYLEIDGQKVWNFKDYIAFELEGENSPLPSDSCYRKDLIILRSNDIKVAQETKEKMEVDQRNDKKLRETFGKSPKSHH